MRGISSEMWSRVKELLKSELNEQAYTTWIGPTSIAASSDDVVTLTVPNKFFQEWLLEHYATLISSAIKTVFGKEMRLEFVFDEAPQNTLRKDIKVALTKFEKEATVAKLDGLGLNPKNTFEGFVVGPGNRFAHAAAVAVSESPAKSYNPLFIYGGVGLGKTHLLHAIGHHIALHHPHLKTLYIASEKFTNQLINAIQTRTTNRFRQMYRTVDILLIDDIHFIAGKESTQEEFFHTFNTLYDDHKQILISSDRPPKDIPGLEERLVSRFGWGLVTDIQPPDLETRIAILRKKAERETISVPDDVMFFVADKIKSNIRELEGALIRVVAYSKLVGKEVDLFLVKEILKDMVSEERKITIESIQKNVASFYTIKLSDMRSKKRSKAVAYPRQIAMYLARELTNFSLPEIGNYFGGRDHTTIIHACNKIGGEVKTNRDVRRVLDKLTIDIKRG
jgi:chromosomal replication initiator protein